MLHVLAVIVAVLIAYVYAATRNWVWCPDWLKRFVFGETRRARRL